MKHSIAGHLRGRSESLKTGRSSSEELVEEDTTVVEPEQNNVLSHIISQLRPGADLSRITLPTFILEERSMLERITNFMAHPETLLPMPNVDDPLQRFVSVVKFYLSGWHIKPSGVKKPLNPILGEVFTGYWDYPDKTKGYYISEQTSHHPPKSSYFFMAPEHHLRVDGTLKPRSKFLGNSAASMMEGISYLRFTNRGQNKGGEKYILTQPNMYARGILFGKMKYELGDHSYVRCPENHLSADIEFKVKGWVGGTYNAIGGYIKNDQTGENLYELSGLWSGEMTIKDLKTGQKKPLFDATHARHTPPKARPIEEQDERESQRLWQKVCRAVHVVDHTVATDEKAKIEDRQRQEAAEREQRGAEWRPKLFRPVNSGPGGSEEGEADLEWVINADINPRADPRAITDQILSIAAILPGQRNKPRTQNEAGSQAQSSRPRPQGQANAGSLIDFDAGSTNASAKSSASTIGAGSTQSGPTRTSTRSSVDALAGNPIHPVSNPKPTYPASTTVPVQPRTNTNFMDDDRGMMNEKMSRMNIQGPMVPNGARQQQGVTGGQRQADRQPIARTDTETSETDVFVDAET